MAAVEKIKDELATGLRLVAFKTVSMSISPTAIIDDTLAENQWDAISALVKNEGGSEMTRFYYGSAQKTYMQLSYNCITGEISMEAVDEGRVLENLSFQELKTLGNLLDKKSVAFIRIYAERELQSPKSEEEQKALEERNARMIQEAEEALRKR